jgi:hypothetical protein
MPTNACDMSRDALPTVRSGIRRVQFMVLVPLSSSSQKEVKKGSGKQTELTLEQTHWDDQCSCSRVSSVCPAFLLTFH